MDKIIYCTVRLNCNIERAFDMFTVNKHLENWLTQVADVEPKVGGKYELFWNPEDRQNDSTIGCKILAIEPNKFLSFEWKGPIEFKHFMNEVRPLTNVAVFFLPKGNETEIHLLHTGWRDSPEWLKARDWFEKVWKNEFLKLKEYVEKME